MLGLSSSLVKGGASLLTFVKDNLKLYLDFKSNKSDTLKFPSEGSTSFVESSSQYISIADSDSLSFGDSSSDSPFSISAWINPVDSTQFQILGKLNEWQLYLGSDDKLILFLQGATGSDYEYASDSGSVISQNVWTHVACTYNGVGGTSANAGIKLYVNGIESSLTLGGAGTYDAMENTTNPVRIGNYSSQYANGKIANVGLWSRTLEQEEIQSIMNKSYSQLKGVETTSLVSWWALDNSSDRGDDFWDVGVFTQEGSPTTSTYSNGLLNVVGNGNNTGARFSFPSTGSTSIEGYNQYEFSFDIKITSGAGSGVKIQYHYSSTAISSTFSNLIDTTEAPNQEFKRFVTTLYSDNSASANRYFIFVQNGSTQADFQVKNIVLKPITANDSEGSNHGQLVQETTTTTSVYGGNAPILPRAVDVAKEGQAEKIGNGSALFNGSTDLIQVSANSNIDNLFQAGGTFTAWVNVDSAGEDSNGRVTEKGFLIFTTIPSGSTCKLSFYVPFSTTAGSWITTNHDINFNEWQHIAITYDGSSTSNNASIYINGISVAVTETSTPAGTISADTATLYIGNNSATTRSFDGEMAQVGIWKGELTQAQIQSVMESTSYSKIPADVKSTLSSELFTSAGDTTGWSYDSSAETLTASSTSATAYTNVLSGVSEGDLVKLSFDVTGHTGGSVYISCGGGNQNTSDFTNGSHTIYLVSGSGSQKIAFDGGTPYTAVLSNISVKEVTNDIVAYYPLDGDSSANGATQDVTTSEVLDSEINTYANATSPTNETNATTRWTSGVYPSTISSVAEGYTGSYSLKVETSSNIGFAQTSSPWTVDNDSIYKLSITWKTDGTNTNEWSYGWGTTQTNGSYGIEYEDGSTDWVTSVKYIKTTSTSLHLYLQEQNSTSNALALYVDSISIKKVLSNTGVLL